MRRLASFLIDGGRRNEGSAIFGGRAMSLGEWQWRLPPADRGRDFGNANAFATPPTLDTLVRETGQNSLDAAFEQSPVTIRYKLIELEKRSAEYAAFSEALRLQALLAHASSASQHKQKVGTRLRRGLEEIAGADSIALLRIDDYGTTGLYGGESPTVDEDNPYYALMRDNLNTSKQASTAGGSFGLGKAVNWTCSSLLTVMVASEIHPNYMKAEMKGLFRISGKAELPWHSTHGEEFAGPGWFSTPGTEFESIWADRSALTPMQLDRSVLPDHVEQAHRFGASLLIVGFRNPSNQGDSVRALQEIERAAAMNFWPAMLRGGLQVVIEHERNGELVAMQEVDPRSHVPSFCEAYEKYCQGKLVDSEPQDGDVVKLNVSLELTQTLSGQQEVEPVLANVMAETHLVVRLAPRTKDQPDSDLLDHIALIRGRHMVVRYLAQRNLLVGGRAFHGLLLAGTAARSASYAVNAEEFLRAAEPPAHDRWEYAPELAGIYKQGTGARLKEFFSRLTNELKRIIRPQRGNETEGPLELRRMLQVSKSGSPGSRPKPAFHRLTAALESGKWRVSGEISASEDLLPLRVTPRLALDVESGRSVPLGWHELTAGDADVDAAGGILLRAPSRRVGFTGLSKSEASGIPASASRLRVELSWAVGEDVDG